MYPNQYEIFRYEKFNAPCYVISTISVLNKRFRSERKSTCTYDNIRVGLLHRNLLSYELIHTLSFAVTAASRIPGILRQSISADKTKNVVN